MIGRIDMILQWKNTKDKEVEIRDINGSIIPNVFYFNTKTKLTKFFLTGFNQYLQKPRVIVADDAKKKNKEYRRKIIILSAKIPGAYAIVDGRIVK